ncbi:hypothetical protein Fmac_008856 [Flemingia macrophylla]|uniref:Glutaredoxin n=1 Tax=Flemingia macrophylla TaxID=520843 RepID=A0ABD1MYK5_9FABA
MGSALSFSLPKLTKEEMEAALNKAKEIVSSASVIVFSKTYCGYCKQVKKLFTQLGASYKVIELDRESDGAKIQAALVEWTGQRTVPNVFIGGKHIGGCDNVMEKHEAGQLVPLLKDSGAIA